MQEEPRWNQFISEAIDEQIDQLKQGSVGEAAEARLVRDLERVHREEREEEQAIERIHARLMAKAQPPGEQGAQARARGSKLPGRKWIGQMNIHEVRTDKHTWTRRWGALAAVLIATLVVASLLAIVQLAHTNSQQEGSIGAGKQATPAAAQTFPGMYLGAGNQVIKIDMQTHKVLWRFIIKSDPNDIPAFQQPQVHYAPSVEGGSVYFEGGNGRVYALNAQTGALHWVCNFQQELGRPYVVDGVLYISTYGTNDNQGNPINDVYALNLTDGTTKMKYKASGSIVGIFDGVMYLSSSHMLTAIRVADGSQIWQTQINAKALNENVYVKNGVLYASSDEGYIYTFDLQSGKITWQSPAINDIVFDIAVGDDGHIYCGAQNHYVYAFDPKANKQLWKYHTAGYVYPAPIVLNGVVYVGQDSVDDNGPDGDHLVALDAATGQQKWATPLIGYTGAGDKVPLVLYNGVIYLSTGRWSGGLLGFAADSGKQVVIISMDTLVGQGASKGNFPMGIAITIVS